MARLSSAQLSVQGSVQGGRAAHAFQARGQSDRVRTFRRAMRHSRLVHLLRIAIPAVAVISAGVIGLGMWMKPLQILAGLPKDLTMVISGTKITMQQPRLAGFTQDSRPYELSAQAAAQDLTKPDMLELRQLRAKMEMQDKAVVELTAATGLYDTKSELLTLRQDVVLISSTGYQGYLSEAVIDIRAGKVVSEKPVHVKMLDGTLDGNRMEVTESGDLVRFDGGVKMMLNSLGGKPPGQAAADGKAAAQAGTAR
jgi:lipopolysaccharide export system protein LptC